MDQPAVALSLPCCHIVACISCWSAKRPCPVCRADILPVRIHVLSSIVGAVRPVIHGFVHCMKPQLEREAATVLMELAKAVTLNLVTPIALPTHLQKAWTRLLRDAPGLAETLCRALGSPVPAFIGTRRDTWMAYAAAKSFYRDDRTGSKLWREFTPTHDETVNLTVKQLTGKILTLPPLSWLSTVTAIKETIQALEAIPPDQQRLIFNGRQLLDDDSIVSCFISDGAKLDLVLRLVGC